MNNSKRIITGKTPAEPESHVKNKDTAVFYCVFAAAVILYLLLFSVCLSVDLSGDDFYYGTFLRDGISGFAAKTTEHFKTFNGRVFVHLAAQTAISLGIPVYAFIITALLAMIPVLGNGLVAGNKDKRSAVYTVFCFIALLLTSGFAVLRESVFWMSASFNYVLPFFMTLAALAVGKTALETDANRPVILIYSVLAFLCGATTEQCGAVSILFLLALSVRDIIVKRKIKTANIIIPLMSMLGYITIFLSPATRSRFNAECTSDGIAGVFQRLPGISEILFSVDKLLIPCVCFILIVFASALTLGKFPKIGFAALVFLILIPVMRGEKITGAVLLCLFFLYLAAVSVILIFRGEFFCGLILSGGICEAAIMAFTNTAEPRTMLPFALTLCLCGALLASKIILRGEILFKASAPTVLLAVCLIVFIPTACGYFSNAEIRNENRAGIAEARKNGVLYYKIDYNEKYYFYGMYYDGYFYNTFIDYYRLSGVDIYLKSSRMKPVYAGGVLLKSPAYVYNDATYYPVEYIIGALGCVSSWTPEKYEIKFGGRDITIIGNTLYYGDGAWDLTNERAYGYYTLCFSEKILYECFGIEMEYDVNSDVYTAKAAE